MARNNVLRWLDGRGWLVLSGGHTLGSEVRAQALGRAAADGGVAYINLGGNTGSGEQALADMDDLGAPPGYLVDVMTEDDQTIEGKLADAGIIVIEAGSNLIDVRSAMLGATVQGMQTAFQNGAVILAEGLSAGVFGEWVVLETGILTNGLKWLENGLVLPGVTAVSESVVGKSVLNSQPLAIALGIGAGSALALGPDGEIETWGNKQITVALGRDYIA
ncbi:MAG: hypothetical protein K8L97_22880 [Anaerolineae bacterium]|nr:hypothetical protein [Anaerolineae bacterium]